MFRSIIQNRMHHQSSHDLQDAPDKPPVLFVTTIVILSFLFVFAVIAISYPATEKLVEWKENQMNPGMANTDRLTYLSHEKSVLMSKKQIDGDHYQIPIKDAMKMTVELQGDISKSSGHAVDKK